MVVKIVGDGGRNEMKKCLFVVVNLVLDFGLMFVKYVFCFEWEKKVVIEVVVKQVELWILGEVVKFYGFGV